MKKNILTLQDHHLKDIPAMDVSAEVWTSDNPYVPKLEVNVQLEAFTFPSGESIPWCLGIHPGTQSLLKQVPLAETLVEAWPCSNWLATKHWKCRTVKTLLKSMRAAWLTKPVSWYLMCNFTFVSPNVLTFG